MKTIDKKKLLEKIIFQLEQDVTLATLAAKEAHAHATEEESKPENQYDTRALEASYLARGQAQRVAHLKEALFDFKNMPLRDFTAGEAIAATALVEVECEGKRSLLFFMPKGGGLHFEIEGNRIQIVTPSTPLGEALFQRKKGDQVFVDLGKIEKEYQILGVC